MPQVKLSERSWKNVKKQVKEIVNRHGIYNIPEPEGQQIVEYDKNHCRGENSRYCTLLQELQNAFKKHNSTLEINESVYSYPRYLIHINRK